MDFGLLWTKTTRPYRVDWDQVAVHIMLDSFVTQVVLRTCKPGNEMASKITLKKEMPLQLLERSVHV